MRSGEAGGLPVIVRQIWQQAAGARYSVQAIRAVCDSPRRACLTWDAADSAASSTYALPAGATPLDFAFSVHTDIGNRCVAAGRGRPAGARSTRRDLSRLDTSSPPRTASPCGRRADSARRSGSDCSERTKTEEEWQKTFGPRGMYPEVTGILGDWFIFTQRFTEG